MASPLKAGQIVKMASELILVLCISIGAKAQSEWPRTIIGSDGGIFYVYQPQPDSFSENELRFKAAFSYQAKGKSEPIYGSFQALTLVDIDKDQRKVGVILANILFFAVSGLPDTALNAYLKETLECGIPAAALDIPLDDLVCWLHLNGTSQRDTMEILANDPPRVIVATKPSILVFIDGAPRLRRHPTLGVNMVVNTPNFIMESFDGWFYLFGGRRWYIGPGATGPFNYTGYIPPDVQRMQQVLENSISPYSQHTDTLREGAGIVEDIVVCTSPAELIQTLGKPVYKDIDGTKLQYIANSSNDIFRDSARGKYFILLSGRWYGGGGLEGPWSYIPPGGLPADLGKIQDGSAKDNVLTSVAGTIAASEAVTDALLPQTAIISRHTVSPVVRFDGPAKFGEIAGTSLQYALNTASVVLRKKEQYYCLEKALWFSSATPSGPWTVCTERPAEVEKIPVECPVYFCKYVYIFGSSPDYIYAGYTSGYLNSFISDGSIVYGTGRYYPPMAGSSYFPRPLTWGFGMNYNPWFGWCLGSNLDPDWFDTYLDNDHLKAGWWGPGYYRPPYIWHHFSSHGLYELDLRKAENVSYGNNLYNLRSDHVIRHTNVLLYTDTLGDVFEHNETAGWMQRVEGQWKPVDDQAQKARLDKFEALQQRSAMRQRNFLRQRGG